MTRVGQFVICGFIEIAIVVCFGIYGYIRFKEFKQAVEHGCHYGSAGNAPKKVAQFAFVSGCITDILRIIGAELPMLG